MRERHKESEREREGERETGLNDTIYMLLSQHDVAFTGCPSRITTLLGRAT